MYKVSTDQVTLITSPASEPVTTSEAKAHLRISFSDDDSLISALITAAREYCEIYTGQSFVTRTYRADLYDFADDIWLPNGPVASITSIQYYDNSSPETLTTWAATNYTLQRDMVRRNYGVSFPTIGTQYSNVQITYTAGWLDQSSPQTSSVPQAVSQAILLMVGDLYENRESRALWSGNFLENPTYKALLDAYRVYR